MLGLLRVGLVLGLLAAASLAPAAASASQTLTISAGAESANGGDVQLNEFAPNQVTVNVGDTITWKLDSTEFHDILFLSGAPAPDFVQPGPDGVFINPEAGLPTGGSSYDGTGVVGSGILNKGQTWSLTFTKAGSYTYICAIHTGMGGIVKVVDPGQTSDTQILVTARRNQQVNADIANNAVGPIVANAGELPTDSGTIGVTTGVQNGQADVQRFFPPRVVVREGDTVSWIWKAAETPHTVTFLADQPAPDVVMPVPQAGGPPKLQLNPAVLAPSGNAAAYDGSTPLNSGFIQPMPGAPTPEFDVTFTTAGSYDYLCLLHAGMTGTVEVLPAT